MEHLTVWVSSFDNYRRDPEFIDMIDEFLPIIAQRLFRSGTISKYNVKIDFIGEWTSQLSRETVDALIMFKRDTQYNSDRTLNFLVGYNGDRERGLAVLGCVVNRNTNLRRYTWTGHLPDLDLIIRTGAATDPHMSNGFMSLLADNAQFAFPDVLCPDFSTDDLVGVIDDFKKRERRFGQ